MNCELKYKTISVTDPGLGYAGCRLHLRFQSIRELSALTWTRGKIAD